MSASVWMKGVGIPESLMLEGEVLVGLGGLGVVGVSDNLSS